jgi:dienelactone hydrolase
VTEVLLFHHVVGLTDGVRAFADDLRAAGHTVHTPDLFDGRIYGSIPEGMAAVRELGYAEMARRGAEAAEAVPADVVLAGFSLGVSLAQRAAQTRPGARGALFLEGCIPVGEFGGSWPADVPVQVHGMAGDPFFADESGESDLDAARELVAQAKDGELFLYHGDAHLFADRSLPSYDADAAGLLTGRVLAFLRRLS